MARRPARRRPADAAAISKRPRGRPPGGLVRAAAPTPPPDTAPLRRRSTDGLHGPVAAPAGHPDVLCLAQPDWLPQRLAVRGPAEELWAFRAAATGAGVLPWHFDDSAAEARWVEAMLSVPVHLRGISAAGVRVLAGELRVAWVAEHEAAAAEVGRARHCPLDLHALVPVPPAVLALGSDHPAALRWLWENWGTTWPLRQVRVLQDRLGSGAADATVVYGFCAADWPPWQALLRLRREWPHLRFELRPEHG